MAGRIEISESELLEALREAADAEPDWGPDDAHTTRELSDAMDLDPSTVRRKLRPMVHSGEVEAVKVRRPGLDGRLCTVPAYRLVNGNGDGED